MRDPRGHYGQQAAAVIVLVHVAEKRVQILHRPLVLCCAMGSGISVREKEGGRASEK